MRIITVYDNKRAAEIQAARRAARIEALTFFALVLIGIGLYILIGAAY